MIINTLQDNIVSPLCEAALYSFDKISICANTLFSFIREEGNAWKIFFSNNYYIFKLYSLGSEATVSIAKKIFNSSNQPDNHGIELSNAPLEDLESSNKAWIRDHSLFHNNYPHFNVSNEALLDLVLIQDIDNEGIIKFAKKFCSHTGNSSLHQSLSDWEKAYRQQQKIQQSKNRPQEMEQISRELSQKIQSLTKREDHMVLFFEKEAIHSNSSLSDYVKEGLQQFRSTHDDLYQTLYSNVKEKLQTYLDTAWKKRLFSEIQEEVRALLLDQYSNLCQQRTLSHNLPIAMQQLLSSSVELSHPEGNESLAAVIWDLFLQNGIDEAPDQPISMEKLNQIFEKEFEMITRGIETAAMAGMNHFVEKTGKYLQSLLQIEHSKLPQKERGWVEITHQSERDCQINLYARDRESPANNILLYGEPSPMKRYSYNKVPKNSLKTEFFFELLYGEGEGDSLASSLENKKQIFSRCCGAPTESYIQSGSSTVLSQGLLDHLKIYYSQANGSSLDESPEKIFFEMRLHALINYCRLIQNSQNVTSDILSTIEKGISLLLREATELYNAGQLSDEVHIAIIATTLDIEECVLQKQQSLRESSEMIVSPIIKEQLRKAFSSINISPVDIENIKSFAQVLLGKDSSEEIALLCKELPIINNSTQVFTLPHVSLWKVTKDLCVDIKNLRTSPIAFFRVCLDVRKLLDNTRSICTMLSYLYISILVGCINPALALVSIAGVAIALGILYATPELKPLLDIGISILNFHREIYTFILTRLFIRVLQVADRIIHWNERAPMQIARSFLVENISSTLSFSLDTPMDPSQESLPKEIAPLQRFCPPEMIFPFSDPQNRREIDHILLPKLSMNFNIQERDGIKRAHLIEQPGFWIADVITDRKLETMDFAHLLLENERGDKKICVIPRSQERLLLQTILRMASSYSRKSIDLLNNYLQDQMAKTEHLVYYYDVVDEELTSQDFNAISYLITHYMASNDTIRSQQAVDQLKKMKAMGRLENPNAILQTVEQISSILPNSIDSDTTKIILQLSSLCTEIPMQSKAFPLFLRAYQGYVTSKECNHKSYLSETEESLLLHHLEDKDEEDQILSVMVKPLLASQTVLTQTLLLLANNLIDGSSISTLFGKEGYIPTSLRKYQLKHDYLEGDSNRVLVLINLVFNNLIDPYFSLGRDVINAKNTLDKKGTNIFDILPTIISKLNTEDSTLKSDYALIFIGFAIQNLLLYKNPFIKKSIKNGKPLLKAILSITRDGLAAFLTNPSNNTYPIEEKFSGFAQTILSLLLQEPSSDFGLGRTPIDSYMRHMIRGGMQTIKDFRDIHTKYKKQQLLRNHHTRAFLELHMGNDCGSLQILEQNILSSYQKINNTFLQRENRESNTNRELDFHPGNSPENQIAHIANWYEGDRARRASLFSYTLRAGQNREDLIHRLHQIHETLQRHTLQQAKMIEHLLTHPPRHLPLLANQVEQYTQGIRNNATAIKLAQERTGSIYSNQSTTKKAGTLARGYINTLLEVFPFRSLQIFKDNQIQLLAQEQPNLLQESQLIQSKRAELFQNIITAFKSETSLGLNEVYAYFCQGKDSSIIESLRFDDNQWKILKEQLYRYMIMQKHLASAEYITGICTDTNRTMEENIDLIGHELDSMSASLDQPPVFEMSIRSQLQFERKLGKSISIDFRNRLSDLVNGSMENFQTVYQFSQ